MRVAAIELINIIFNFIKVNAVLIFKSFFFPSSIQLIPNLLYYAAAVLQNAGNIMWLPATAAVGFAVTKLYH